MPTAGRVPAPCGDGESSACIRDRVVTACHIGKDVCDLLKQAVTQLGLSARAYDRILKLARTVADLEGESGIGIAHVAEAIQYRALDRKLWG